MSSRDVARVRLRRHAPTSQLFKSPTQMWARVMIFDRGSWAAQSIGGPTRQCIGLVSALPTFGRQLVAEQSHASFATKIHKIAHFRAHLHFLAREGWRPALASELGVADGPWHQMPRNKLDANSRKYWKSCFSFLVCSLPLFAPSVV